MRSWVGHVDQHIIRLYTHIADQDSQDKMRRLAAAQNGSENSKDTETSNGEDRSALQPAQVQHTSSAYETASGANSEQLL